MVRDNRTNARDRPGALFIVPRQSDHPITGRSAGSSFLRNHPGRQANTARARSNFFDENKGRPFSGQRRRGQGRRAVVTTTRPALRARRGLASVEIEPQARRNAPLSRPQYQSPRRPAAIFRRPRHRDHPDHAGALKPQGKGQGAAPENALSCVVQNRRNFNDISMRLLSLGLGGRKVGN